MRPDSGGGSLRRTLAAASDRGPQWAEGIEHCEEGLRIESLEDHARLPGCRCAGRRVDAQSARRIKRDEGAVEHEAKVAEPAEHEAVALFRLLSGA